MFSLCPRGFSPGTPASSHRPEGWGLIGDSKCMVVCLPLTQCPLGLKHTVASQGFLLFRPQLPLGLSCGGSEMKPKEISLFEML